MNITNIYADPDCPDCNGTGERDSGGTHPWGEPISLACDCVDAQIGKRWRTNSSLENWFPLTAEKLGQLSSDLEDAQGEIRALRATEAGLRDQLAALEKAIMDAEPVAWLESDESTKDWPVRDLFFGFSAVAYSSRLHFGIRPNTRQGYRLTPLYTLNGIKKP